jgi:hypothetical protein
MDGPTPTPDELRAAWMDATRAAELAERLTEVAREATDGADRDPLAAAEIALLAGSTAEAASRRALDDGEAPAAAEPASAGLGGAAHAGPHGDPAAG